MIRTLLPNTRDLLFLKLINCKIRGLSFPDLKSFFKAYRLTDDEGYMYTDRIQFWVMDLTQIDSATEEQKDQGLVEWAKAFRANSWDEVKRIQNAAVREAAKTMELIITNPSEREILRMRQDARTTGSP